MIDVIQKGGPVMYPLLACSLISLAFIIERFLFWFVDMRRAESGEVDEMLEFLRCGKHSQFLTAAQTSRNPIAGTLAHSLSHGEKTLSEALSLEIDTTIEKTRRSLNVIDTCVTLTPLLGIFGTVVGIIRSFELLGSSGIAEPHAVSSGIAEALITTATGLAIAMPSLIFYNYFSAKSERFIFRLEKYAREFEILYPRSLSQFQGKEAVEPQSALRGNG